MPHRVENRLDLASLVDHMFDQVMGEPERAELLSWIRTWEAANPGLDAAHRVTGWIDVAYAFQARLDTETGRRRSALVSRWRFGDWGPLAACD